MSVGKIFVFWCIIVYIFLYFDCFVDFVNLPSPCQVKGGGRRTVKEQTVLVDVGDNRTVTASSVIKSIEEQVGEGEILACVPKSGNLFEITLSNDDSVDLICDTGFKVGDNKFKPNAVFS